MTTPNDPEAYSNPVRLNVATRETSSNAIAGPSTFTSPSTKPLNERERLFEARKANEIVRRKGEKWADKLMEETVDRETFKKAVSITSHASSTHQSRRGIKTSMWLSSVVDQYNMLLISPVLLSIPDPRDFPRSCRADI